ncbi:sensor histidine kinase [Streptomyces sp. NPDC004111]|uniref:sensor histidine kinase n=1 Tax=Streptomyces sp. NPDC004111 TaxID=3364690 RepID=UPI0036B5B6E1
MKTLVRRGVELAAGLALGACTALVELALTLVSGAALLPVLGWPRGRNAVLRPLRAVAVRLTAVERTRLAVLLNTRVSAGYDGTQALRYLAVRWIPGLLGAVVLAYVVVGAGFGTFFAYGWLIEDIDHPLTVAYSSAAGLLLFVLSFQGVFGLAVLEGRMARHFLGPSGSSVLEHRIAELAASRAGVVEAVQDERRRIERDLHDGVQQRLVALGMLIGRARRSQDPEHARQLLLQAHEESRRALDELRDVAWRVHPTVLDEAGLRAAVETVVARVQVPVLVHYEGFETEPPPAAAGVAYFVIAESVTNAVKHAAATRLRLQLDWRGGLLRVGVEDDGVGGADPAGGGLIGLGRRVAALDGRFGVDSPPGGPTTITAEIPCA